MQLIRLRLTTRDTNNMQEADNFGRNWYSSLLTAERNSSRLGLTTRDATDAIPFQPRDATDTLEAVILGRNWYTWSGHLVTQLIHLKRSPCDAADTLEAATLLRSWYTWSGHLATQLIRLKLTPWDATDTISWPRDATRTSPFHRYVWHTVLIYRNREEQG